MSSKKLSADQKRWRWVILVVSFLSTFANAPIFYAFGAFVLPWMREFSAQGATIAFITSCGSSISGIMCPFGSFLVQRWGYRRTHMLGGLVISISFAASSLAQSLVHLFLSYSILGGIGSSLCLMSYVNALTDHFHRHQGIAFAIVTSSYGIGGFVFPLFFQALIQEYTWRGAMLITSAIFSNVIICGLLMYPAREIPPLPAICGRADKLSPADDQDTVKETFNGEKTNSDCLIDGIKKDGETPATSSKLCVCRSRGTKGERAEKNSNFNDDVTEHDDAKKARENEMIANNREIKKLTFTEVMKALFTSWLFYIFVIHNITSYMGYFMIFGLTPIRASYDYGMSDVQATMLVSTFGVAQMVCRLGLGILVEFKCLKVSSLYIVSYYLAGIAALLSLLATTYHYQIVYCIIASATFAVHAFYPVVVYQAFGDELFNVAFGFLEINHGIGTVTGPLIGGYIFDVTGTCQYSFIYAGICILCSITVLLIGLSATKQMRKLLKT